MDVYKEATAGVVIAGFKDGEGSLRGMGARTSLSTAVGSVVDGEGGASCPDEEVDEFDEAFEEESESETI